MVMTEQAPPSSSNTPHKQSTIKTLFKTSEAVCTAVEHMAQVLALQAISIAHNYMLTCSTQGSLAVAVTTQ